MLTVTLIFLVLCFFLMLLGMFQNPLHLINSLINCIYSTQEYFLFLLYLIGSFFITCYPYLMFLMPFYIILRIFIGIIVNSCCSSPSVLVPLELVVRFVISAFQCFTSVFISCLSIFPTPFGVLATVFTLSSQFHPYPISLWRIL